MAEPPDRRPTRARRRLPACDGHGLLAAFETASGDLAGHVDEINALNVFPVPDGDTGTNMAGTMRAAVDEARSLEERQRTVKRVAAAIGFGSLMGARGNSGVILSQIFRGMSDGLDGRDWFDGRDLAHAFVRGSEAAYRSVGRPVEGTMLTVIRETSSGAVAAAERRPEVPIVMTASVEAAGASVARTPELLPILREAGVVDAGGQGLYRILEGALRHMAGGRRAAAVQAGVDPAFAALHEEDDFGYETVYVITASERPLDPDRIRLDLQDLGRSVLVAGDASLVKIHVHNERPDEVIAYGLALGPLTRLAIENLDVQAQQVRERREAATAEAGTAIPIVAPAPVGPGVVVVAPGEGLARAFRSLGASAVVRGGQSANPATGELLEALRSVPNSELIVLPNNPNVRLAAQQAASLVPDRRIVVLPTRNAAEGIAALVALDPNVDLDANAERMAVAAGAAQTLQVTRAVRDARVGTHKVRAGQAMALGPDEGIVALADDERAAALAGVVGFRPGFELLTLYRGAEVSEEEATGLADALREAYPDAEIEVVAGGQPHYGYLIAAE